MVQRRPALGRLVLFEHREVDHPKRRPAVGYEAAVFADFAAQRAECVVHDAGLVGTKEDQVARFRARALEDGLHGVVGKEFQNRRLQPVGAGIDVVDLDIGKTAGAIAGHVLGVVIDDLAAHLGAAWYAECGDATLGVRGWSGKHLEVHRRHEIRNLDEFEVDAQVRFV